jgi:hypothetical protein
MRADQVALMGALAWSIPPLRPVLETHLEDNFGEMLPHLLIADYERWAESAVQAQDPLLMEFLRLLEDAFRSGGPHVQELISVSFLEHLPRPGKPSSELRALIGPTMQQELRVIG